jgi:hypothetical protein
MYGMYTSCLLDHPCVYFCSRHIFADDKLQKYEISGYLYMEATETEGEGCRALVGTHWK